MYRGVSPISESQGVIWGYYICKGLCDQGVMGNRDVIGYIRWEYISPS
jgi:hypothetical protein